MESSLLPTEVLVKIFEYLDFDDLKSVTLVSRGWLYATQITKISKNIKLCLCFITVDDTKSKPLDLFYKSTRTFANVYFENTKFVQIDENFWSRWSSTLVELTFDYKQSTPELPGSNFVRLIKYTPKLKTLNLICCLHLFNQYVDELAPDEAEIVSDNMKNVTELCLYFAETCLQVETFSFGKWIDDLSQLKNIDFDLKSAKKKITLDAYETIFRFLRKHATVVKGLHICDNSRAVDKHVIDSLLGLEGLKLKAFDVITNTRSKNSFEKFLKTQDQLLYLTTSGVFSPSKTLPVIPKLKELAISNGGPVDGFKAFDSPKLESLGIAALEFYTDFDDDTLTTYNMSANKNLKELYLIDSTIEFSTHFVSRICQNYSNIRLLNIDGALIDDEAFQVFYTLTKLEEFKFSRTDVSDYGITSQYGKSKAKKARFEHSEVDGDRSLETLKNLIVVNMDFCKRISNVSMKRGFRLPKMKHFSAQGCLITETGFDDLTKKNPKIESMTLSKSTSINDQCIAVITKRLANAIETLEIASCPNVTTVSLNHLMKNCKKIQTIDLSKCAVDIDEHAKEMFEKLESLRRIILQDRKLYRCNFIT